MAKREDVYFRRHVIDLEDTPRLRGKPEAPNMLCLLDMQDLVGAYSGIIGLGQHQDGHDNAIKTQYLRKDEDQDQANVQSWLLSACPNCAR